MLTLVCNDNAAILFMFDLSSITTLNSVREWFSPLCPLLCTLHFPAKEFANTSQFEEVFPSLTSFLPPGFHGCQHTAADTLSMQCSNVQHPHTPAMSKDPSTSAQIHCAPLLAWHSCWMCQLLPQSGTRHLLGLVA